MKEMQMEKIMAKCAHGRITLLGSEETGLQSAKCSDCGVEMSRKIVNGQYEYSPVVEGKLVRDDVHRPAAIVPGDYEYVAQEVMKIESFGDCIVIQRERELIKAHMAKTGGTYSGHAHGGNCMVCGSVNAHYTVLFYHQKTNSYVRFGQDCARKLEMGDERAFKAFREGVDDARKLHAGKTKARLFLEEQGVGAAFAIYEEARRVGAFTMQKEEQTIEDVVGKLVRYGQISEAQVGLLRRLLEWIKTRAERMAKREAERAAALPCPTGRIEIKGTVLSTKYQHSDYAPGGEVLKMTVKSADGGWVVYGSVPSCLELVEVDGVQRGLKHGDRIEFKATVEPSDKDPKFGFFKRPTQAAFIGGQLG